MVVKTTKITIETESRLVVRRGKTIVTWCPTCCTQVEAMTLDDDSLGDAIPSTLFRDWLAVGKLHLWHPNTGPAQVCLKSLLQCFESVDARRTPDPKQTFPRTGEEK